MLTLLLACASPSTGGTLFDSYDLHMIPGPAEQGYDADLAALVEGHDRVHAAIGAAPYGMSLDAAVPDRTAIDAWAATGSGYSPADFEEQSGLTVYSQVSAYDEMGDLGMFGGVAAVGTAYKYALLREDAGASPESVEDARAALVVLLEDLHIMQAITGRPGSLVRGLAHYDMPGLEAVETTPMTDEAGAPLPTEKSAVYRADQSGDYPDWLWIDDTSKDQFDGYILALGVCWEVAKGDPDIDPGLVAALESDASDMGRALMVPSAETGLDLTLIDGDGRPTTFHDLNARELEGAYGDDPWNASNAVIALGGLRVLATVSGDPEVSDFYHEVATDRGYATLAENIGPFLYFDWLTNYSGVNMGFTAAYSWCRFEEDADLVSACQRMVPSLMGYGRERADWDFDSAWFTFIAASIDSSALEPGEIAEATANLTGFHPAPYWSDAVVNCDEAEIATGTCLAIDGETTITLYGEMGESGFEPGGDDLYATSVVPQAIRSPSNFEWRSDPYRVNGGGGDTLNPAGDIRAAYWLGRWLVVGFVAD